MFDTTDFLRLLFDDGQQTCFTPDPHGTAVKAAPGAADLFFSINALDASMDHGPVESYHDAYKPRRADINVTCFRNFLLELDGMPMEQQIAHVTALVPVSSIVHSGGKSYHFIISLEDALPSLMDYRNVARQLHALVPQADPACKNPSRLSRLPGRLRPDTGNMQQLVQLGARVPNKQLMAVLPPLQEPEQHPASGSAFWMHVSLFKYLDSPEQAIAELGLAGRNGFFFWLGNRLAEAGFAPQDRAAYVRRAYSKLQNTHNFDLREALQAARINK